MWLVEQNAILMKNNLLKRNWNGDGKCCFCAQNKTVQHMFFECTMARHIWSLVAVVVGVDCGAVSWESFWIWVEMFMPRVVKFHMVGLAGICWAIWRARNNICFEQKF